MAFEAKNFIICSRFPLFNAKGNLWMYKTLDTLDSILADVDADGYSDYFMPRKNLKNHDSADTGDVILMFVEGDKLVYLKVIGKREAPYKIKVARTYLENEATLLALITELQLDKASKATDFATPITEENLGITQEEQEELEEKIDTAANSGRMITAQGFWYAKMHSETVVPDPTIVNSNYADFSQVDGEGNPVIVTYNATDRVVAQQTTGTGLAVYAVIQSYFKAQISDWGNYEFIYDGADWSLNGNTVTLMDYGIDFTGTATSGDVITAFYGIWTQDETITPPADYDGYVPITKKIWDITEQDGQQGGRILWNHTSKQFTPYPNIISFDSIEITGDSTVEMPATPSDDNIANVGFVKNTIGAARNIGDFFFTTRTDLSLNGAVECNGGIYSTEDFSGIHSIGNLLAGGKIPYVSLATYATLLSTQGSVGVFGWDGVGTTAFRVPSLEDIFIETGTAAQIGDYLAPKIPNIKGYVTNITSKGEPASSGALYSSAFSYNNLDNTSGNDDGNSTINIDASRSSGVYDDTATTVQPNAVRYRPMVQLAVSATDEAVETCTAVTAQVASNTAAIAGADYVVESQLPTAQNNYTWYRKYKSGWVEQGGRITVADGTNTGVVFPVAMADTGYIMTSGQMTYDVGSAQFTNGWALTTYSTTGFTVHSATNGTNTFAWEVKGVAAQMG